MIRCKYCNTEFTENSLGFSERTFHELLHEKDNLEESMR